MDKEISLELDNDYGPALATSDPEGKREPDYPTFHFEGKNSLNLPEEGEMTVRFRRVSETSSVKKDGGHRYSCTIELQSILNVEGEEEPDEMYSSKSSKDTESALDKIKSLLEKEEY